MCGILGQVVSGNAIARSANATKALNLLHHRGPDTGSLWLERNVLLGHRRLSIVDPSTRSNQPFIDGDLALVFNGEIYNYVAIRSELLSRGHKFKTGSDTEVLLAACREWDVDCISRLEGIFAFALWNRKTERLVLARDRYGEKPLFYTAIGSGLSFASEVQALTAMFDENPNIDEVALGLYFKLSYIPAPSTIFEGVFLLEPGQWLEWSADFGVITQKHYKLSEHVLDEKQIENDYETAQRDLRKMLNESVKLRMESADVPVATFLSGGIDSSIVTALAAQGSGTAISAYSLSFPNEPDFDESHYARLLADKYANVNHRVIEADEQCILEYAEGFLSNLGEPYADASILPTGFLSSHVEEKVVLGGDGADEVFAGYGVYQAIRISTALPEALRHLFSLVPPVKNPAAIGVPLLRGLALLHRHIKPSSIDSYLSWRSYTDAEWFEAFGFNDKGMEVVKARLEDICFDTLRGVQVADMMFNLPNDMLRKVDYASMAHGLEVRLPFLDSKLVHWALRQPEVFRMKGKVRKRILKDAFGDILPNELINRRKQGFLLPLRNWFKSGQVNLNLRDLLDGQDRFSKKTVIALLKLHESGRADYSVLLWALYVYLIWHKSLELLRNRKPPTLISSTDLSDGSRVISFQ